MCSLSCSYVNKLLNTPIWLGLVCFIIIFSWYLCFRKLQWLLYLHKQCFWPFVGNFVVNGNWLVLHITGVEEDSMYPNEFCHFFCKLSLFICLENSPSLSVSIFTAELFCDRTEVHCLHHWQKVLNSELMKGPWT